MNLQAGLLTQPFVRSLISARLLLVAVCLLCVAASDANAQYATGGSGLYRNQILWFSWAAHDAPIAEGTTVTNTYPWADQTLAVTCTITNIVGGITAYRPGTFTGDSLDDLYNVGGTGDSNDLVIGVATSGAGGRVFDFSCSATLDGNPLPLPGLVFADAEANAGTEFIDARIPSVGTTWRIIDRFRPAGCTNQQSLNVSSSLGTTTLRIGAHTPTSCSTGPGTVAFMEGATAAHITLQATGRTAVALGVMPPGADFGDAPSSYALAAHTVQEVWSGGVLPLGPTNNYSVTLATLGSPPLRLGASVDVDASASFSFDASGDDIDVTDDEDGVVIPALTPGTTVPIQVTVPNVTANTRLQGWIDWNADGSFAEPGDQILTNATVVAGVNTFNVVVPPSLITPTYARFRIADQSGVGPSGLANSGEVEDYADIVMTPADWGDAPASYGTSLSGNGPRHLIAGPYLGGAAPDAEADGVPSTAANGDDAIGDDEDGVVVPAMFARGTTVPIQVTVGNVSAGTRLSAWIDWLGDGSFANINDRILVDAPVVNGMNTFNVPVPLASLAAGTVTNTYARFRLANASGLAPTGLVLSGEVEDYPVVVQSTANISVTKTDNSLYYIPGTNVTYTIVVSNAGPTGVSGNNVKMTDLRPTGATGGTWTCTATNGANCHSPGGTILTSGTGNVGGIIPSLYLTLPANSTITFSYTITVPSTFTGNLVNTAAVTVSSAIDPTQTDNSATDTDTPVPADLTITKVSTPNPYVAGDLFTYTIVASNLGPANAPGATISDTTLPAAVNGFAWTCTGSGGATCGTAGGTVSGGALSTLANLPVGGSATIVVTGTLPMGTTGALTNTATVTPPAGVPDPVMSNNTGTDVNPATISADLRISKASTPNPYVPGSPLTYIIVASNGGPYGVAGARVQDTMPAAFATFTWTCAASGGAVCPATGGTGDVDTLVDLPVGGTATFTITGTVPSNYTAVADNTATITPPAGTPDPVPGNNTSVVPNPPNVIADLAITKAQTPDPYLPGGPIAYSLLVQNLGPSDATNARVQDTLPGVVTGATWTCTPSGTGAACGAASGVNVVDALVTLPAGTSATFTITGTVVPSATGVVSNTATVTPPPDVTDPVPGNNESRITSGPAPLADLTVTKTATPNPYVPGTPLTYTVVVGNTGPSDALNSRVQDLFPAALSGFTWTCAPTTGAAVCGTASGVSLIDVFVDLPVGSAVTFTVTGTVPSDTTGALSNTATVTVPIDVRDPDPTNNKSTVTLTPGPIADLRVSKSSTPNPYVPGGQIVYRLVYTNVGPSAVSAAHVQDQMPPVLTNVAWTCTAINGTCAAASGTGNINSTVDLTVGGTVTFTITATVPSGTSGPLLNSATIVPPPGSTDPTPDNNTGIDANPALVSGGPADLQITQEFPGVAPPNGLLTFRLVTKNLGSNPALNPYITGMIPPGTTFVSANPGAGGTCTIPGNPPAADPVTGYPIGGAAVAPLRCTWPGLMQVGDSHVLEFTVRVSPATPTGQILWSCFWTWSDTEDPYHANNVVDSYLFTHDGTSPNGDLSLQGAAMSLGVVGPDGVAHDGTVGTELAVPVGATVKIRFWSTNAGPNPTRGQYALILDTTAGLEVVDVALPQGWISPSGPSSAVWDTGPVQVGQTVSVDLTVRVHTTGALKLFAQRVTGAPGDPDASDERATIVLDGYGPNAGGRWVAVGNVDGAGKGEILTGTGQGETPQVRVYTGAGADTGTRFFAYERTFTGGVRIASCDVNGDGIDELITAPGPGRAPTIRVLRVVGGTAAELIAFDAFESTFTGGASVSCADLDGDGRAELVVGAGPGRAPTVQVYNAGLNSLTLRSTFLAYEDSFQGGVRVAAGAYPGRAGWINGFDIATMPGPGRAAELRVWQADGAPVAQAAVSAASNGTVPVLGDANGDGTLDLIITPDDGRPELVRIIDIDSGNLIIDVPGNIPGFATGIRAATGVLSGGMSELVIGNAAGGDPRVRVITWTPGGPVLRLEVMALEIP